MVAVFGLHWQLSMVSHGGYWCNSHAHTATARVRGPFVCAVRESASAGHMLSSTGPLSFW